MRLDLRTSARGDLPVNIDLVTHTHKVKELSRLLTWEVDAAMAAGVAVYAATKTAAPARVV